MKFKKIIGGTEKEAYKKFPWLKSAGLRDATIDITAGYVVWKDGTWRYGIWKGSIWEDGAWKSGIWKGGIWKGGIWENGTWESGAWKGGTWEAGKMWSNLGQKYLTVKQINGVFVEEAE